MESLRTALTKMSSVNQTINKIKQNRRTKHNLINMGYPKQAVDDTYKRRQATPCIKITPKAFGNRWKMPMVNKYKG